MVQEIGPGVAGLSVGDHVFANASQTYASLCSVKAADLARVRFKDGATGLLDLLDAQRVELQAEDAYAESHSNSALSAVLLYKSLAGGWPQHLPPSPTGKTP